MHEISFKSRGYSYIARYLFASAFIFSVVQKDMCTDLPGLRQGVRVQAPSGPRRMAQRQHPMHTLKSVGSRCRQTFLRRLQRAMSCIFNKGNRIIRTDICALAKNLKLNTQPSKTTNRLIHMSLCKFRHVHRCRSA